MAPEDRLDRSPGQADRSDAPATHLPSVARRVSAWTTNLLVTAVIVLVALLLGRQLVDLYRATPTPSSVALGSSFLDNPFGAMELQFGASPMVMYRHTVTGDQAKAVEVLCNVCARQMQSAAFPPTDRTEDESKLLAQLANQKTVRDVGKDARLYQWGASTLSMVVGVRTTSPGPDATDVVQRVVLWGMAMPTGDGDWMLYSFRFAGDGTPSHQNPSGVVSVPTPPEADLLLTVRSVEGDGMTAFRGSDGPDTWIVWYRNWFEDHDWIESNAWRQRAGRWHAQYRRDVEGDEVRVDLQFSPTERPDDAGEGGAAVWRAILTQTTVRAEAPPR